MGQGRWVICQSQDAPAEHKRGKFPNATQSDNGTWSIPADDLAGAGYKLAPHEADGAENADGNVREGLLERLERESEIARLEIASTLQADAHATEVERLKNDLAAEQERTTDEVNRVTKERDRAVSDAEHHRAEVERLKVDLARANAELTGANRLVDELRASRDAADRRAESAAGDLDEITAAASRILSKCPLAVSATTTTTRIAEVPSQ